MDTSSVEASLFKCLYELYEVTDGVKIFENVYYVDFETFDKWIVIDALTNSLGVDPRANFALHVSTKGGLLREKEVLNRLVDKVVNKINQGFRFEVYDSETFDYLGEAEVCAATLLPAMRHQGGGSYRTLSIGIVYVGEVPG